MDDKMKFQLNVVIIQNDESKQYTAYLSQFPEVISDGLTEKEALDNLIQTFKFFLDFKRREVELEKKPDNMQIRTLDFNYDFA